MSQLNQDQVIIITEDSDDDYEITVHALKKAGDFQNPIHRCEDGQDLLDYLEKGEDDEDWKAPGLILLDLNMPGIDGRTALQKIKTSDHHKDIPIIVLSTSDDQNDINACYKDGVNSYIHKPVDLDGFFHAIKQLKEYWFEVSMLPKKE